MFVFRRWLRLLFLREMEFPACIVLWDALFALDNREFSLTNEIFVSLLICLRGDLLDADQSTCMHMLMQPHLTLSPLEVLKTALYLHDPGVSLFSSLLVSHSFAFDPYIFTINQSTNTFQTYKRPKTMESALDMTAGSSRKSSFSTTPAKKKQQLTSPASHSSLMTISTSSQHLSASHAIARDTSSTISGKRKATNGNHKQQQQHQQQQLRRPLNDSSSSYLTDFDVHKAAERLDADKHLGSYRRPSATTAAGATSYKRSISTGVHSGGVGVEREMNVFQMQGSMHNVDLAEFTFKNKVRLRLQLIQLNYY